VAQRDHWTEKLTCPNSMASNVVELSQPTHNSDAYHALRVLWCLSASIGLD
jgi:hypothetical protein